MNGKKLLDLLERTDVKHIEEAEKKPNKIEIYSSSNASDDCEKCRILTKVYFSGKTRNSPTIKEGESQVV